MNTTRDAQSEKSAPSIWISGLLGGVLALIGVLALFGIAGLLNVPLQVGGGPPDWNTLVPLTAAQFIPAVIIPALAATALYALLRQIFRQRANRIFQIIALVALLLSFGGPWGLAVSAVNKIFLALMHVVTAAAIVWALTLRK